MMHRRYLYPADEQPLVNVFHFTLKSRLNLTSMQHDTMQNDVFFQGQNIISGTSWLSTKNLIVVHEVTGGVNDRLLVSRNKSGLLNAIISHTALGRN